MLTLILDTTIGAIRSLCALLCEAIYPIISFAYSLFIKLATFELLTPTAVREIYKRFTIALTIIMAFYMIFEFVKYIMQPDTMTDKEKGIGNLPLKLVLVLALIALVPNFFTYANKIQNSLIKNEVVSKLVLGRATQRNSDNEIEYDKLGKSLSWNILSMFYYLEDPGSDDDCDGMPCSTILEMNRNSLVNNGYLNYLTVGINSNSNSGVNQSLFGYEINTSELGTISSPYIHFDGIWAVVVGGFIAYILVLYCIDVAARVIQVAYLQIVAPIPIVGILSPKKDSIFTKWLQQCLTTYLDVFIRLAIIYFVMLLCNILLNTDLGTNVDNADTTVKIALILGLLVFAKRAPKLIEEIFPKMGAAGGNFGLSAKDRNLGIVGRLFGAATGTAAGAAAGLTTGIAQGSRARLAAKAAGRGWLRQGAAALRGSLMGGVGGAVGGAGRGLISGSKKGNIFTNALNGAKGQIKANQRYGNRQASGYSTGQYLGDRARAAFGFASREEQVERQKAPLKRKQEMLQSLTKTNEELREYAFKKAGDKGLASYAAYAAAEGRLKRLQEDKDLIATLGGESSLHYKSALAQAKQDMKKYKEQATDEYIKANRNKDGKLVNLFAARDSQMEEYNRYASNDSSEGGIPFQLSETATITMPVIDPSTGAPKIDPGTGKPMETKVTKKIEDMTSAEFDQYIKEVVQSEEGAIGRELAALEALQQSIQRQTANSGLGDNNGK